VNVASPFLAKGVHWLVPRIVNPLFTGRGDIVKRIKEALMSSTTALDQKRFILMGMGGQGKSEVCLSVVNEVRDLYVTSAFTNSLLTCGRFWGIFWADVGSESIAQAEFSKIAEKLGSTAKRVDDVRKLLSDSSPEHNWLLVLDNADDPDTDYQKYFPTGNRGVVLMTSRVRECGMYGTVGSEEIDSLAEWDCVNLLLKGAEVPEASWSGYISAAKNIINVLQSHTLALLQAAAYIAGGHCSMAEYPKVFQRQHERLLRFGPKQAQSRYGNVYTTFEASVDVLKPFETETPSESLILLHLLSTLHYESVPLDLFEDAWHGSQVAQANPLDDDNVGHLSVWHVSRLPTFLRNNVDTWDSYRFTAALSQLESLALVKKNNGRGYWTVTMHPLVHSWLAIRQNHAQISQALQMSACIIALSRYSQPAWQRSGHTSWRPYRGCLGLHLLTLLSSDVRSAGQTKQSTYIFQVFMQIGWLLHDIRYDQELARLLVWIFRQLDADPECSSEGVLLLSDIASRNAYNLGRTKKSIKISEEIVRIREAILDEGHPERLESQHKLACALLADGQTKRAVTVFEHVVRVHETTLDEGHPDRLASQHGLAGALLADGQTKRAVTVFEHVVRVHETTLDEGHPHRLASQHRLAGALLADGQTKRAVTVFEHVVRVEETTLDKGHPDRLASQHGLAGALLADGQTKRAVTVFEHVIRVHETTLDEGHPHRLASQHGLARALLADGQTKRAVTVFEHVVRVEETTLDEGHPHRLASEHALTIAIAVCTEASDGTLYLLDSCIHIQLKSYLGSGYVPKARQPSSWFRKPFKRGLSALKTSWER